MKEMFLTVLKLLIYSEIGLLSFNFDVACGRALRCNLLLEAGKRIYAAIPNAGFTFQRSELKLNLKKRLSSL
jgi:hypothetical protein